MAVTYPSTLPLPELSQHAPRVRAATSDLPGADSYSVREYDYGGEIEVEFFFNAAQAPVFWSWWKTDLIRGGLWFNCSWPSIRPGALVAQFVGPPVEKHLYDGAFRVTAKVQVRGAALPVVAPLVCALEGSSLTGFTTVSGNGALYSLTSTPYGTGINCASQSTGTIAQIRKPLSAKACTTFKVKFQLTALNSDDACALFLYDATGTGGLFGISPRREIASEPASLGRAIVSLKQTSTSAVFSAYVGSAPLANATWYELSIAILSGVATWLVTRLSDGAVIGSGTATGSTWTPITVQHLLLSTDAGGLTSPVVYTGIEYCGPG